MIVFFLLFSIELVHALIFGYYNVYVQPGTGAANAFQIVEEQLNSLRTSGLWKATTKLTVHLVCAQADEERFVKLLKLHDTAGDKVEIAIERAGDEVDCLEMLWQNARAPDFYYYIHAKGSFHPGASNTMLRRGLMNTVVDNWQKCFDILISDIGNVCGMRFSPYPHPHFPGSMWWTTGRYLNSLLWPRAFSSPGFPFDKPKCQPYSTGRERYGAEHWICGSPHCRPYDCLPENHKFIHSYVFLDGLVAATCKPAPRPEITIPESFDRDIFHCFGSKVGCCTQMDTEFKRTYPRHYAAASIRNGTLASFLLQCLK